ncbi:type I glyceraldehyde-3-phosphate dehydrogenase [Anaerolineales bacterium HSG25]|nr:type I glyceraldehyde-3-phosphate dehydrogenase [Anaerolineales bacterium HSG25]
MTTKVGINGFGRIGRQVFKVIRDNYGDTLEVVAVNDIGDVPTMAHLLKYDSNYGKFNGKVEVVEGGLNIDGKLLKVFAERDPAQLGWGDLGVDIVVEATGFFRDRAGASKHIEAGAKKVIISAPAKGEDLTVVLGVNDDLYDSEKHHILSNASCTTNCLAPPAKVVNDKFGIVKGLMTTIHAYTNDQKILDLPHSDLRRARAAAMSMIPTTTGAAKAVALVIPELKGKVDGYAIRVPTSTVSLVDCTMHVEKETTTEELRAALKEGATNGPMKNVMEYVEEPLVSIDYKGDPASSSIDASLCQVIGGNLVKFVTWYDNEWGYSNRTADLADIIAGKL